MSYCCVYCCGLFPSWFLLGFFWLAGVGERWAVSVAVQVQESAVGKYWSELSGFLILNSSSFLKNVGHVLLQLAWSFELHEMHAFSSVRQLLDLCGPAQLPQVSFSSVQSLA